MPSKTEPEAVWENVGYNVQRLIVPGGWIYQIQNENYKPGSNYSDSKYYFNISTVFVPYSEFLPNPKEYGSKRSQ